VPLLRLDQIGVRYGAVEVVHGVDFRLDRGEVLGMIGPNGAGKSSILRAICGLVAPSRGSICFEGRELNAMVPERIVRLGLALVPEGRQIFKTLSVAENLRLGARGEADSGLMGQTMERFPILAERAGQPADQLSGGEQQQLAIARALLSRPRLLILDEPSLGLAPKMIDAVYELLGNLREEGMTMLLAEQNATRTIAFSDRCVMLGGGRVLAQRRREELQGKPDLLDACLGGQP
jgi:branched-chain amino acid transport system ATP-binding protein